MSVKEDRDSSEGNLTERERLSGKRRNLVIRAEMIEAIRKFFPDHGYLEVETPLRIPSPLPEGHIDAIESGGWFLQTSPEITMKRLLASGYGKIFQICKCFRSGERGALHNQEFTMLEWYRAHGDYLDLMEECERLVTSVAERMDFSCLSFKGNNISLRPPWPRLSVREAFDRFAPVSMEEAVAAESFDELLATFIEPRLGVEKPGFLYDYPLTHAAQARLKKADRKVVERMELYIGGLEIANGFSELTDPDEYLRRFDEENTTRLRRGKSPCPPPRPFLKAVGSLPESCGIALGIDRLAMVFADASSIDEVMAFSPEDL